mmetsp:Transcript_36306/g.41365  ORF Transcript_36306/g.41365 Transcript_36306/m.41365 type:complete len:203 (-) Transcript_36306:162-770(-)
MKKNYVKSVSQTEKAVIIMLKKRKRNISLQEKPSGTKTMKKKATASQSRSKKNMIWTMNPKRKKRRRKKKPPRKRSKRLPVRVPWLLLLRLPRKFLAPEPARRLSERERPLSTVLRRLERNRLRHSVFYRSSRSLQKRLPIFPLSVSLSLLILCISPNDGPFPMIGLTSLEWSDFEKNPQVTVQQHRKEHEAEKRSESSSNF